MLQRTCSYPACLKEPPELQVKTLPHCNRCKEARYCSKECQKLHWKNRIHKLFCVKKGRKHSEQHKGQKSERIFQCNNPECGRDEASLSKFDVCGRCGTARYCSQACATQDWKRHKRADCVPDTPHRTHSENATESTETKL